MKRYLISRFADGHSRTVNTLLKKDKVARARCRAVRSRKPSEAFTIFIITTLQLDIVCVHYGLGAFFTISLFQTIRPRIATFFFLILVNRPVPNLRRDAPLPAGPSAGRPTLPHRVADNRAGCVRVVGSLLDCLCLLSLLSVTILTCSFCSTVSKRPAQPSPIALFSLSNSSTKSMPLAMARSVPDSCRWKQLYTSMSAVTTI